MIRLAAWDSLFNVLLFLFWLCAWSRDAREGVFNPYLGPVMRWARAIIAWLRPIAPGLGDRGVAALALALLTVFRALLIVSNAETSVGFGLLMGRATGLAFLSAIVLSLLSFGVFLFKIWSIAIVYVHAGPWAPASNAEETLEAFFRPLALAPVNWRPLALAAYGMVLALSLESVGFLPPQLAPALSEPAAVAALRQFILALAAWTDALGILQSTLILLILGSWIGMFAGSPPLQLASREWMDFFMGPLRRYPLQIGPVDLTPLVMLVGLSFAQRILMYFLLRSYLLLL